MKKNNIIALIVLGYERDRHITGLHLLATNKPNQSIKKVYVALTTNDPYVKIGEENAEYMEKLVTTFFPEIEIERIRFNSYSLRNIAAFISYIIEREKDNGEIWIDLTSTTKEVISLSTFFTLFGVRIYWVTSPVAKQQTRLEERVRRSFMSMKQDFLKLLDVLLLHLKTVKTPEEKDEKIEAFFQKTIATYYNVALDRYKDRKATGIVEMPLKTVEKKRTLLKPIKLREVHKKLLTDLEHQDLSLRELQLRNEGSYSQMSLRYALTNLFSIGFVITRNRKYGLTEIGSGYAAGIKKANTSA